MFYAGHGLQVDGENFLVPVDARIEREADVPLQAVRLADLMNALSAVPSKSRIVILDACRNNPFSAINKTAGRGLAIVDAPNGSIVSYSTAPGTEALDGDGQNSPFTTALMKIGHEPGLQIEQLLKRVRLDVSNTTARQQFPWESSSLTVEFSFFPAGSTQERATPAGNSQPGAAAKARSETRSVEAWQKELKSKTPREAYEIVVREDQVEGYQAYLALYPSQSTASAVRSLTERRQLMVAWYTAVTVNTVASYQAFLASYGTSDFAATADRLIERARTRSVSGAAAAAFASVSPTCPCSLPATPTLRQRRTDTTPTQTPTQNTGSNSNSAPKSNVAVIDPIPVVIPTNPVVTLPPRILGLSEAAPRPRQAEGHVRQRQAEIERRLLWRQAEIERRFRQSPWLARAQHRQHPCDQQRRSEQRRARSRGQTDYVTDLDGHRHAGGDAAGAIAGGAGAVHTGAARFSARPRPACPRRRPVGAGSSATARR